MPKGLDPIAAPSLVGCCFCFVVLRVLVFVHYMVLSFNLIVVKC